MGFEVFAHVGECILGRLKRSGHVETSGALQRRIEGWVIRRVMLSTVKPRSGDRQDHPRP